MFHNQIALFIYMYQSHYYKKQVALLNIDFYFNKI